MGLYFGSFGGIKLHSVMHINGGSDEIDSPLNIAAIGIDVSAQDIVNARNNIGATTIAQAQSWVNSYSILFANATGLLEYYTIGTNVYHSHDAEVSVNSGVYTKLKTITIANIHPNPSVIRLKFDMRQEFATGWVYGRLYKNGGAVGALLDTDSTTYLTFSEDLSFATGDTIELWGFRDGDVTGLYQNFRVYGSCDLTLAEAISHDDIGVDSAFDASNSTP